MPLSLLIKPASGACDLRCRYCFYTDEMNRRERAQRGMMSLEVFEALARRAREAGRGHVTYAFQGGEPTLRGLPFFLDAARLARAFAPEGGVRFALQTNGLSLDDAWCDFLLAEDVLVGLSIDGPASIHNACRVDARGAGTCARVLGAARLLEKRGVPFNALAVVTQQASRRAADIYRFLMSRGIRYQQYILCLDPIGSERGAHALTPEGCGRFLCDLFDCWYADVMSGRFIYIRYFENLVGMARGVPPESCGLRGCCGVQYCVEADGSVYPCDFYAVDEWLLGNVLTDGFDRMDARRDEMGFIEQSVPVLPECAACPHYALCRGGCRRERDSGQALDVNKFCAGYKAFFDYATPRIRALSAG